MVIMKPYLIAVLFVLFSVPIFAQGDMESMAFDDIEIDGFENVWVKSELFALPNASGSAVIERVARPKGGNTNFIIHVQNYWGRLLQAAVNKYPIEMLNRQGYTYLIVTNFTVDSEGKVVVDSVYGGSNLGYDIILAQKMFNDYKKWRPALCNGADCRMKFSLRVDLSL